MGDPETNAASPASATGPVSQRPRPSTPQAMINADELSALSEKERLERRIRAAIQFAVREMTLKKSPMAAAMKLTIVLQDIDIELEKHSRRFEQIHEDDAYVNMLRKFQVVASKNLARCLDCAGDSDGALAEALRAGWTSGLYLPDDRKGDGALWAMIYRIAAKNGKYIALVDLARTAVQGAFPVLEDAGRNKPQETPPVRNVEVIEVSRYMTWFDFLQKVECAVNALKDRTGAPLLSFALHSNLIDLTTSNPSALGNNRGSTALYQQSSTWSQPKRPRSAQDDSSSSGRDAKLPRLTPKAASEVIAPNHNEHQETKNDQRKYDAEADADTVAAYRALGNVKRLVQAGPIWPPDRTYPSPSGSSRIETSLEDTPKSPDDQGAIGLLCDLGIIDPQLFTPGTVSSPQVTSSKTCVRVDKLSMFVLNHALETREVPSAVVEGFASLITSAISLSARMRTYIQLCRYRARMQTGRSQFSRRGGAEVETLEWAILSDAMSANENRDLHDASVETVQYFSQRESRFPVWHAASGYFTRMGRALPVLENPAHTDKLALLMGLANDFFTRWGELHTREAKEYLGDLEFMIRNNAHELNALDVTVHALGVIERVSLLIIVNERKIKPKDGYIALMLTSFLLTRIVLKSIAEIDEYNPSLKAILALLYRVVWVLAVLDERQEIDNEHPHAFRIVESVESILIHVSRKCQDSSISKDAFMVNVATIAALKNANKVFRHLVTLQTVWSGIHPHALVNFLARHASNVWKDSLPVAPLLRLISLSFPNKSDMHEWATWRLRAIRNALFSGNSLQSSDLLSCLAMLGDTRMDVLDGYGLRDERNSVWGSVLKRVYHEHQNFSACSIEHVRSMLGWMTAKGAVWYASAYIDFTQSSQFLGQSATSPYETIYPLEPDEFDGLLRRIVREYERIEPSIVQQANLVLGLFPWRDPALGSAADFRKFEDFRRHADGSNFKLSIFSAGLWAFNIKADTECVLYFNKFRSALGSDDGVTLFGLNSPVPVIGNLYYSENDHKLGFICAVKSDGTFDLAGLNDGFVFARSLSAAPGLNSMIQEFIGVQSQVILIQILERLHIIQARSSMIAQRSENDDALVEIARRCPHPNAWIASRLAIMEELNIEQRVLLCQRGLELARMGVKTTSGDMRWTVAEAESLFIIGEQQLSHDRASLENILRIDPTHSEAAIRLEERGEGSKLSRQILLDELASRLRHSTGWLALDWIRNDPSRIANLRTRYVTARISNNPERSELVRIVGALQREHRGAISGDALLCSRAWMDSFRTTMKQDLSSLKELCVTRQSDMYNAFDESMKRDIDEFLVQLVKHLFPTETLREDKQLRDALQVAQRHINQNAGPLLKLKS